MRARSLIRIAYVGPDRVLFVRRFGVFHRIFTLLL